MSEVLRLIVETPGSADDGIKAAEKFVAHSVYRIKLESYSEAGANDLALKLEEEI